MLYSKVLATFVAGSLMIACHSVKAASAPVVCQECTEAPDSKCPQITGNSVGLQCSNNFARNSDNYCPPGFTMCEFTKMCYDQIPEHYELELYEAGQSGYVNGFSIKANNGADPVLLEITYPAKGYVQSRKFVVNSGTCYKALADRIEPTAITVTKLAC